jgi:hypothetical protein
MQIPPPKEFKVKLPQYLACFCKNSHFSFVISDDSIRSFIHAQDCYKYHKPKNSQEISFRITNPTADLDYRLAFRRMVSAKFDAELLQNIQNTLSNGKTLNYSLAIFMEKYDINLDISTLRKRYHKLTENEKTTLPQATPLKPLASWRASQSELLRKLA